MVPFVLPIHMPEEAYEMTVAGLGEEGRMTAINVWRDLLSDMQGSQQRVTVHLLGGQSLKGVVVEFDRVNEVVVLDEYAQGSAVMRHESPVHTIVLSAVQAVTVHKQD
ncbi:RNA chaperone Hfq [Nonomuraea africana]|uniref:SRNA-binding regulator protein Hfq n=1 Tax=Nonomuraea africana TaxID=46171 RepID=A0ABR9KJI5_9ACTN|nr:RNA chaperone Hfq [Nonomuraea africana]MBE1561941.1 sRNA-binding regulator protein Hfq [Nonomuraea africana]